MRSPAASPSEQPKHRGDHDYPQQRVHHQPQNGRDDHDDYRDENVDQHSLLVPRIRSAEPVFPL
jgi:hypothetical protein